MFAAVFRSINTTGYDFEAGRGCRKIRRNTVIETGRRLPKQGMERHRGGAVYLKSAGQKQGKRSCNAFKITCGAVQGLQSDVEIERCRTFKVVESSGGAIVSK